MKPQTVAHMAPLSMEFSRQGYWSRYLFLSPGGLPDPGIEPRSSLMQVDAYGLSHQGSPKFWYQNQIQLNKERILKGNV